MVYAVTYDLQSVYCRICCFPDNARFLVSAQIVIRVFKRRSTYNRYDHLFRYTWGLVSVRDFVWIPMNGSFWTYEIRDSHSNVIMHVFTDSVTIVWLTLNLIFGSSPVWILNLCKYWYFYCCTYLLRKMFWLDI